MAGKIKKNKTENIFNFYVFSYRDIKIVYFIVCLTFVLVAEFCNLSPEFVTFLERVTKSALMDAVLPMMCTSRLIAAHRTINAYVWTDFLQVMAQSIHLRQEKIDVGLRYSGAGNNIPEEVGPSIVRLVTNHQRASLHHATFQNWTYLA